MSSGLLNDRREPRVQRRVGSIALILGLSAVVTQACVGVQPQEPARARLAQLRVSENSRFLETIDGQPFFYLADTAWGIFHKTTREEALRYLDDRRRKGFSVIQASVTAAGFCPGLGPNRYGARPFHDDDPRRPNEAFFDHVDWVLDAAEQRGLYVALLPTWGEYVCPAWHDGPKIFDSGRARHYGRWLGARNAARRNLIWIIGGDRRAGQCGAEDLEIWRSLARGIREGATQERPLMTYHTHGLMRSSLELHDEEWLDFNMLQSGHCADEPAAKMIAADYALSPAKPTVNSEPAYENIPSCLESPEHRIADRNVRRAAYASVFAGGLGHAYGAAEVFSFWNPGEPNAASWFENHWQTALDYPGAGDMQHLRALIESRPFFDRIPEPAARVEPLESVESDESDESELAQGIAATRGRNGGYLFVYFPTGGAARLRTELVAGDEIRAYWFDPRDGSAAEIDPFPKSATRSFSPPTDEDWVLVLDDASRDFPPPGDSASRPPGRRR